MFGVIIYYPYLCFLIIDNMRNFLKAIFLGYLVMWIFDIFFGKRR